MSEDNPVRALQEQYDRYRRTIDEEFSKAKADDAIPMNEKFRTAARRTHERLGITVSEE